MTVRVLVLISLALGTGVALGTNSLHRATERAAWLNQLIRDIDSIAGLIASNDCQAAQNRLDEIAAAFDECAELAAAPRICNQVGPLLASGKFEESLHILDFNRIAVTNSLVLSVLTSRLQTQICGVVVADLEAKRMERYRHYQTGLQRLTAAREERDQASARQARLEKEIQASLAKNAKNPLLDIQLIQAKRDYDRALTNIATANVQFQRVMRAHARAFAQLGLANSLLAEYQEMVVNAEFTVAGGPRIHHTPRRLEEIPRAVTAEVAPPVADTGPAPLTRDEPFLRKHRFWILGGVGAFFVLAIGYFVAKR